MEQWERDGLVEVLSDREGRVARITDKGRRLARKAMS
jgi:DNA-binding PadR family transcriptional regulator